MQRMVRMGELAISDTQGEVLTSLGLGSCIGLAVGGASMFAAVSAMDVGSRNAAAVRELLAAHRISVTAEAVGGSKGRTIRVDVATGGVSVREAGGLQRELGTAMAVTA